MPLFRCEQCGCVENTACCNYWSRKSTDKDPLCSACDPDIWQWHGIFPQRSAAGMLIDQQGHLWSKSAVEGLPGHYRIVGEVPADNQGETK